MGGMGCKLWMVWGVSYGWCGCKLWMVYGVYIFIFSPLILCLARIGYFQVSLMKWFRFPNDILHKR